MRVCYNNKEVKTMNNDYLSIGEMAKMNHITVTTLRLYDELDLLSQFTIADKVILNKPMTIIGESGDIGQLQWYGILFYTDYPLCPIPCLLCTSIA